MKDALKKIYIYLVSYLPKKNIVLFESHSDFSDSSKKLYDTFLDYNLNKIYKLVWLVENPEKYNYININNVFFVNIDAQRLLLKLKRAYYYTFAKYCFYTHRFIGLSHNKNQIIYFLNHSSFPIKNVKNCYEKFDNNTYIEATSELSAYYRSLVLGGGLDRMKILGLPRNDCLFENKNILKMLNLNNYKNVIIWMPTFKHHKNKFRNDFDQETDKDISLLNNKDLKIINDVLNKTNSILIIKFHPAQDMDFVQKIKLSNIITLTNEDLDFKKINLYNLLSETDALITDYSSVYFDYLLLNKPIAFELVDKEKFQNGKGFMVENPLDYMPGEKIYNVKDFVRFINNLNDNIDDFSAQRKKLLDKIHKYQDGNSSIRILQELNLIPEETRDYNEKI